MCNLSNPIYHDADKARVHLQSIRWADGPICPHCGVVDNATELHGKAHRPGLYKCRDCRKQFSVTVGTVFERSHIPLNKWLLATHLMTSSKKGISSHQLHRSLGVTYKTAWFMAHRIRHAMENTDTDQLGGPDSSGVVEADETFLGSTKGKGQGSHLKDKQKVLSLVEREGRVRSFHVPAVTAETLKPVLLEQIDKNARLMTDGASYYKKIGPSFASHETVNHFDGEYVRGDVFTNTIEGYFSIFKRGMRGVYQHCSEDHLHRYLAEFDFRYNHRTALDVSDTERCDAALKAIEGKRLTYRRPAISYS